MEEKKFPRTMVGGVSLSRMIIGTNWMLGWSHRTPAADHQIQNRFPDGKSAFPMLKTFLDHGVDTIMGPMVGARVMQEAIEYAQEQTGKKLIVIDTPILNVDDNRTARAEAQSMIRKCKEAGATFCLIHHSSAEQLVNKNKHEITRLDDYTQMIREAGMIQIGRASCRERV